MPRLSALLLAGLLAAAAAPALGDEPARERSLHVTGTGTVMAEPDMARISTGVESEGQTAAQALSLNSRAMARVIEAIEKAGIERRDIRTTSVALSPVYSRPRKDGDRPEIAGYRASNEVTITARELDALGPLLDAVTASGANRIGGIAFDISEREALTDEARTAAVADALRKARLMAEAAGATLGEVITIQEQGGSRPEPYPMARMAMAEDAGVPIAGGEERVSASVALTFALE